MGILNQYLESVLVTLAVLINKKLGAKWKTISGVFLAGVILLLRAFDILDDVWTQRLLVWGAGSVFGVGIICKAGSNNIGTPKP